MLDHLVFLECPDGIRKDIRAYWTEKHPRFERLLSTFDPELCHLRLVVQHVKGRWATRCVLSIPTATLAARKDAEHWSEGLDGLADRLASEIRRHKARLRHDDAHFHQGLHTVPWQTAS
jgi:ribosome-associated translation inhibitor RaiA